MYRRLAVLSIDLLREIWGPVKTHRPCVNLSGTATCSPISAKNPVVRFMIERLFPYHGK